MTCTEWPELVFHTLDEDWQRVVCAVVSVPFIRSNRTHSGGATVVLRCPHHTQTIRGDGNCLFRSFSYVITGTQKYHYDVHSAIVAHMFVIEFYIRSHGFESTEQYLQATRMNKPGVWATDIEIYTLVHLLNTPIVVYVAHANGWGRYSPCAMQSGMHDDVTTKSMFLRNYDEHFDVVLTTQ